MVKTDLPQRETNGAAIETLFKMVYEQSRSLVSTLDLEGRFLHANRIYAKTLGFPVDDLLGRSVYEIIHPDDREAARAAVASMISGETVRDFEIRFVDRSGQPVRVLASGALIRTPWGEPVAVSTIATDVSETERLREELRAQAAHHEAIVENSDVLFIECDQDGRITSWNRASEALRGVDRGEAIGKIFFELMARRGERETLRSRVMGVLTGTGPREFECPLPSAHGASLFATWNVAARKSASGEPLGFVAIGRDTTESHRAARETMRVRETLENILQSLAEGLFVVGPEGETTYWNRRMEEITGLSWAETINRKTESTFPWLYQTGFAQTRDDLLSGRLEAYESTPRAIETPGGVASVVLRAVPYRSAGGQISGTIVRLEDVTESLRLRTDLVLSEARYKNLVDSATDCIHVLDLAGRFVAINAAGLRLCGLDHESLIVGRRYDHVVNPESSAVSLHAIERARGGETAEYECTTTRPDGEVLSWSCVLTPVRDPRGRVQSLLGISRDITDRKRLDDELREKNARLAQALEDLERASTLKDDLLSNVSHELRTPLASIRSYAEILLDYPDEDPSVRREFLGIVKTESQRLTTLVTDVLDLAKIESGDMPWQIEPHGVEDFVGPAIDVARSLAMTAGIAIEVAIEPGLPHVPLDKDRFQQVVLNLLSNAIKHSSHGGVVRVEAGRAGTALCIRVKDTGCGLSPEELGHLFDKYFQSKMDGARKGGTGLGLAISRQIVTAFGGKIWAESVVGSGSTFAFTIPLAGAPDPRRAGTNPSESNPRESKRRE